MYQGEIVLHSFAVMHCLWLIFVSKCKNEMQNKSELSSDDLFYQLKSRESKGKEDSKCCDWGKL